jgi:hypothetical protein
MLAPFRGMSGSCTGWIEQVGVQGTLTASVDKDLNISLTLQRRGLPTLICNQAACRFDMTGQGVAWYNLFFGPFGAEYQYDQYYCNDGFCTNSGTKPGCRISFPLQ